MCINTTLRITIAFLTLPLAVSCHAGTATPPPAPPPLDVNDVSFLWPLPTTKAEADALISLNDEATEGKIFPEELWAKVIDEAKTVNVGETSIQFPNEAEFKKTTTWKVAGIRVNPSALGSNPQVLMLIGVAPSIRLIVQPVTLDGDKVHVHDFAAHVVLTQTKQPTDPSKPFPFQPDNDAFNAVISELRDIKAFLEQAEVKTANRELGIHPGFRFADGKANEVSGFSGKLRTLLKNHWSNQRLVISFMGIPEDNKSWIFFKVTLREGNLSREPVSGHFGPPESPSPKSQMLSFRDGPKVEPAPVPNPEATSQGLGISTALLLRSDVASHLTDNVFPTAAEASAKQMKLRDVPDFIANPALRHTGNTDCVSCHTETTLRRRLNLPPAPAFKHPDGISKVADSVLPKDRWNVRDFGWGLNIADEKFKPTIAQRAANEAAESADLINKGPLVVPVSQPIASNLHP